MTRPRYIGPDELDALDPVTQKPVVVVPAEPVAAGAPNRGTRAAFDALEALQMYLRVLTTASFKTTPNLEWRNSTKTLVVSGPLQITYTLDFTSSSPAVERHTTLLAGNYVFPAGKALMVIPLGIDGDTTISPGGGQAQFFASHAELVTWLRARPSRDEALRHMVFAQRSGTSLLLLGRHVLRTDVLVTNAYQDTEYQGTAALGGLDRRINRDRNLVLQGGGTITVLPTGLANVTVQASEPLTVVSPLSVVHTITGLTTAKTLTPETPNLIVSLSPVAGPDMVTVGVQVVATNAINPDDPLQLVLARLHFSGGERRVTWRDGTVYRVNDSYPLGLRPARTPAQIATDIVPFYVYPNLAAALTDPNVPADDRRLLVILTGTAEDPVVEFATREQLEATGPSQRITLRVKNLLAEHLETTAAEVGSLLVTQAATIEGNLGVQGALNVGSNVTANGVFANGVLADSVLATSVTASGGIEGATLTSSGAVSGVSGAFENEVGASTVIANQVASRTTPVLVARYTFPDANVAPNSTNEVVAPGIVVTNRARIDAGRYRISLTNPNAPAIPGFTNPANWAAFASTVNDLNRTIDVEQVTENAGTISVTLHSRMVSTGGLAHVDSFCVSLYCIGVVL